MPDYIALEQQYSAHNYLPLPLVLVRGKGVYVWDSEGHKYMDMMSAYSAVSLGYGHPEILVSLTQQAEQLAVCSRAFYTDRLGALLKRACEMTRQERALPMNTGAEAVETALKAARKWAYRYKGVKEDKAEIIACDGNFHGRTLAIIGLSTEPQYRAGFGPFPTGLKTIPYGSLDALANAITENTAAFLVEPIQGEAGIVLPPPGYLKACEQLCRKHNVLLICDEVQTGLGRTGALLACEHEQVQPDGVILGKALGGGVLPVSLFLARDEVMAVFEPGDHGSTFGGNPLASAVALTALNIIERDKLPQHSARMGEYFMQQLADIRSPLIKDLRGKGLFIGLEIDSKYSSARAVCEVLASHGVLSKETHDTVVRLAPPLIITQQQIDWAVEQIRKTLEEVCDQSLCG